MSIHKRVLLVILSIVGLLLFAGTSIASNGLVCSHLPIVGFSQASSDSQVSVREYDHMTSLASRHASNDGIEEFASSDASGGHLRMPASAIHQINVDGTLVQNTRKMITQNRVPLYLSSIGSSYSMTDTLLNNPLVTYNSNGTLISPMADEWLISQKPDGTGATLTFILPYQNPSGVGDAYEIEKYNVQSLRDIFDLMYSSDCSSKEFLPDVKVIDEKGDKDNFGFGQLVFEYHFDEDFGVSVQDQMNWFQHDLLPWSPAGGRLSEDIQLNPQNPIFSGLFAEDFEKLQREFRNGKPLTQILGDCDKCIPQDPPIQIGRAPCR